MGKIVFIMGKSASGKDTIFQRMLEANRYQLRTVTPYTTRPMRASEQEGIEYHFVNTEVLENLRNAGKVIEERTYQTVQGPWTYFTPDDGQIDLHHGSYLMIGTLESYIAIAQYYGSEQMVPVYLTIDDGVRLERALARERQQEKPNYAELCRRYLADEADFSNENLKKAGISHQFLHINTEETIREIEAYLKDAFSVE